MMEQENVHITKWKSLISAPTDQIWSEENLNGYFQLLRPDGVGIKKVFENISRGDEILIRLKECYEVTSNSYSDSDVFFIPRPNKKPNKESIESYVLKHLKNLKNICEIQGDQELIEILDKVSLSYTKNDQLNDDDDNPNVWIHDVIADFMFGLKRSDSPLFLLREAFYSIANDSYLRNYLMWPLYDDSPIVNPFDNYFWLWKNGIDVEIISESQCNVYLNR